MKKIFVLIAVAAGFFIACSTDSIEQQPVLKQQSRYITKEEARKQVLDLLNVTGGSTRSDALFEGKNITSSFTRNYTYYVNGEEQNCDMYVFNFGDNDGYAAILSDVRTDQLLVLTSEGHLDEGETNFDDILPPVCYFNSEVLDTMDHDDTYLSDPYDVYEPWETTVVGYGYYSYPNPTNPSTFCGGNFGLTKVHWYQDAPFNVYCPVISGQHAPAGCVATATAMLLSYYEYPSSYNGYSFNWTEMKKYPEAEDLDVTYQNQIARIVEILGRSENLDMNYQIDQSGSNITKIPRTLNNLGFSAYGSVSDYNVDFIRYEINFANPVIVSGKPLNSDDGHAWIIDAYLKRTREIKHYSRYSVYLGSSYQTTYYFHCNWGVRSQHIGFFLDGYFAYEQNPAITENGVVWNANPIQYFVRDMKVLHQVAI